MLVEVQYGRREVDVMSDGLVRAAAEWVVACQRVTSGSIENW